jgi:hypothetical protein
MNLTHSHCAGIAKGMHVLLLLLLLQVTLGLARPLSSTT